MEKKPQYTQARRNPKLAMQLKDIANRITVGLVLTGDQMATLTEMLYKTWNLDGVMIHDDVTMEQLADADSEPVMAYTKESEENGSGYFSEFWVFYRELINANRKLK